MPIRLQDQRTKALGLTREASQDVKKVCLEYGVPKPPPRPQTPLNPKRKEVALEMWESWMPNSVLKALASYIALDELESRTHKERLRLLKVLSFSQCFWPQAVLQLIVPMTGRKVGK